MMIRSICLVTINLNGFLKWLNDPTQPLSSNDGIGIDCENKDRASMLVTDVSDKFEMLIIDLRCC